MIHSFDPAEAETHGLNAAIILNLMRGWIAHNKANARNLKDGRTWTYNSVKAWSEIVPYLTPKQIRTAIDDLVDAGMIVKGNFNENAYDRTLWYSLSTESTLCPTGQIESPKAANQNAPGGESVDKDIPDKEPKEPATPAKKEEDELSLEAGRFVEWFIELLAKTGAPAPKLTPTIRAGWGDAYEKLRRIDGKPKAEIVRVCEWARADNFWRGNFYAPTKLRERKDGISRYDLFLSKLTNTTSNHGTYRQNNGRTFSQNADVDFDAIAERTGSGA